MLYARIFIPILALARTRPMVRTKVSPISSLRAEDAFDLNPRGELGTVAAPGLFGERLSPFALSVNVAFKVRAQSFASIFLDR